MRIAVFSDTHDRYPSRLPAMLRGADELWHLGDVCAPETLEEFTRLGPPLRVVLGNCDSHLEWPVTLELERENVRFHLTHIPPSRAPKGAHAVLHGHLHVPRDEMIGTVRWLNPGCITRPSGGFPPSFAWLTVADGKMTWETVPLR
ncbi:MAG: metallophosphoesterase family protein [Opitutaceae bacterium]